MLWFATVGKAVEGKCENAKPELQQQLSVKEKTERILVSVYK